MGRLWPGRALKIVPSTLKLSYTKQTEGEQTKLQIFVASNSDSPISLSDAYDPKNSKREQTSSNPAKKDSNDQIAMKHGYSKTSHVRVSGTNMPLLDNGYAK